MDKEDVGCVCIHTRTYIHTLEYYSAIKKNEVSFVGIWMDGEVIILSEVRQRKTNTMISLMCGI